jgi:hypothetical protein
MLCFQRITRTTRIVRHLRLRFGFSGLFTAVAYFVLYIAPLKVEAQIVSGDSPAGTTQHLYVHLDKVLVSSFMGFGVQLDPYVYPPSPQQWQRIRSRLNLLHPAFLRVMFSANDYCYQLSAEGCADYVWNERTKSPPESFEQLLRILDYAEAHKTPVMLGEWSWPRLNHDATVSPIMGPGDPRWAEIIVPMLRYLCEKRHYTVLRFYNYMNEPNGGWMWPGGSKGVDYEAWKAGLLHMRQVLDQNGLQSLTLVGPDNSGDWNWLDHTAQEASSAVGAWEMHWYPKDEEVRTGQVFTLLDDKRRMLLKVDSDASSKPRFMGEAGLITGRANGDQQPRVRSFSYGVLMADYAAQVAQAGWMGASAWDLDDAMHAVKDSPEIPNDLTLKTWGFWNSEGSVMSHPEDEAIRPWFTPWLLLAHLFTHGAQIFEVSDPKAGNAIRAIAAKNTVDGKQMWSMMLVNDHDVQATAEVNLPGTQQMQWRRFQYLERDAPRSYEDFPNSTVLSKTTQTEMVNLPANSVVFLATYDLSK